MSLKVDVYNHKGTATHTLDLPEEIFTESASPRLLALAVTAYQANQRSAQAKTKSRGQIVTSTRKIWRQKGTGRARHGDRGAPIFVGGGKAHGPRGQQNFVKRLTQKMRQKALRAALTLKVQEGKLSLVSDLDQLESKTKTMQQALVQLTQYGATKKVLIVLEKPYKNVLQAAKNLPGVSITQASRLNTYEVIAHDYVLTTPEAIEIIAKNHQKQASLSLKKKSAAKTKKKSKSS